MPINPDRSHKNQHTLYLAKTGCGKTEDVIQNKEIPKRGARVLLWDPNDDYQNVIRFTSLSDYRQALIKAIKSGKGFRLAFSGMQTRKNFIKWCELVWLSLDGNKRTYIIIEESAAVSVSSSKAESFDGVLINQSRKYGGVVHLVAQRPASIPKDLVTQFRYMHIGQQANRDINPVSLNSGIDAETIQDIKQYCFACIDTETNDITTYKLKKPA